jgi:hypothetical protein
MESTKLDVFLNFKDNKQFSGGATLPFAITPDGQTALPAKLKASQSLFKGTPYQEIDFESALPVKLR